MNRPGLRSALGVALLLASAASAQESRTSEMQEIMRLLAPKLAAQIAAKAAAGTYAIGLSADSEVCQLAKLKNDESCKINVTTIRYPDDPKTGKTYCVALVPDVAVPLDRNGKSKRMIRWKLEPDTLNNGTKEVPLSFPDESGIVIIRDDERQLDRVGKIGDGLGSKDNRYFRTWTTRDADAAQTHYVPVILWGEGETAQLCAAVDPKIVNVEPESP